MFMVITAEGTKVLLYLTLLVLADRNLLPDGSALNF